MVMFVCDICGTNFKTTQHLNQHKNKKKTCVKAKYETNKTLLFDETINEIGLHEDKSNITYNDIVIFLNTYKNIQSFINDKEFVLKSKNETIKLREENLKLKKQLEIIKNIIKNDFSKQPSGQYNNNDDNNNDDNKNNNNNNKNNKTIEQISQETNLFIKKFKNVQIVTPD
jgi:hypothetical protein